jgi:hypothetical protein
VLLRRGDLHLSSTVSPSPPPPPRAPRGGPVLS